MKSVSGLCGAVEMTALSIPAHNYGVTFSNQQSADNTQAANLASFFSFSFFFRSSDFSFAY